LAFSLKHFSAVIKSSTGSPKPIDSSYGTCLKLVGIHHTTKISNKVEAKKLIKPKQHKIYRIKKIRQLKLTKRKHLQRRRWRVCQNDECKHEQKPETFVTTSFLQWQCSSLETAHL